MNKSQQQAIDFFRSFLERELDKNEERGDTIVQFDVEATEYGSIWITARTDMLKLGEGNLLRALSGQYWLVLVGKRGALDAKMFPKCFDQFRGKGKAFGMTFSAK
jgi:hypothetical protein